jgi:YidC/Oxa1 family membrane protein insertase
MSPEKKSGGTAQFILLFLGVYLGLQLLMGGFRPAQEQSASPGPRLTVASRSVSIGNNPSITIANTPASTVSHGPVGWVSSKMCSVGQVFSLFPQENCERRAVEYTGTSYALQSRCPQPPVDIFVVTDTVTSIDTGAPVIDCPGTIDIAPGHSHSLDLSAWKYAAFSQQQNLEIRLPNTPSGTGAIAAGTAVRLAITEPGLFAKIFRTFITAPFLNFLIFVASITPGHNLGIAIIILTLTVKLLLFLPTQHAMEGQKKMQLLQPKIEELRSRFGDDQKRLQEETMKLWKEHKINPFSSCLPLLIQFPILIGLFYVIRDGSTLALSKHLIYPFYQNLPWHFGTSFLGLDLLKPEVYVMPILLVVLQFFQMKLSFAIQKRKTGKSAKETKEKKPASPDVMQQRMMTYLLPLMIGFFALRFPAAVSVYWGISTLFGIGQQLIVNREHLKV